MILLAKSKLNGTEVLISKALIDSVISHDEFVLKNVLKQYNDLIKNLRLNQFIEDFSLSVKQCYHIIV